MTRRNTGGKKIQVEPLKLNKETVTDLTDAEAEAAEGGHGKHYMQDTPRPTKRMAATCPTQCPGTICDPLCELRK